MNNLELLQRASYGVEVKVDHLDPRDHGCLWFYGPRVGSKKRFVWLHFPHPHCDKYRVAVGLAAPHIFETNDFGLALDRAAVELRRGIESPDVYVIGSVLS